MAGGGGGMMTTLVHGHPEQYLHKSRFTRYLQYFRDGGPSYMINIVVNLTIIAIIIIIIIIIIKIIMFSVLRSPPN